MPGQPRFEPRIGWRVVAATAVVIHAPPAAGRPEVTAELCAVVRRGRFGKPVREFVSTDEVSGGAGPIPVLHTGRLAELDAVIASAPELVWLKVLLWVPWGVAQQRAADEDELREWEHTRLDLAAHPEATWAVALRADAVQPARAAEIIRAAAAEERQPAMRTAVLHRFLFR
jgi:hypothetical protein